MEPKLERKPPHILITNDDGIYAPGLRALVEGLQGLATLSVVAPAQERSGSSQSLTLRQPVFFDQVAEREWAVEGTPADTVIVALHRLFPELPDLVVSGINGGANLGENIFYSGTVGAAVEGALNGVPALAVSLAHHGAALDFGDAAQLTRRLAALVLERGLPEGVLLNVNVPRHWAGAVRVTQQSKKVTRSVLQEGRDPRGRTYYTLSEMKISEELDPQSDYAAVIAGAVSITPLEVNRTYQPRVDHLAAWAQALERPVSAPSQRSR